MLGPEVEMVASCDSSRRTFALSNGPVLREGACSGDRWLVVAGVGADLVGTTVGGESTKDLGPAARVVTAIVLNDIVFSLWRIYPAINCEIGARAGSIVVCRVGNGAC